MIVTVAMRVTTDDGIPMLMSEQSVSVLQVDFESNMARAGMTLDDLTGAATKSMQRQLRALRDNPPPLPEG